MWQWFRNVADGVLRGDPRAYQAVIERLNPFARLKEFGATEMNLTTNEHWFVRMTTGVSGPTSFRMMSIVSPPPETSVKPMPKTTYWGYYQEYVCGAALRFGRELLHLVPIHKAYVDIRVPLTPDDQPPHTG